MKSGQITKMEVGEFHENRPLPVEVQGWPENLQLESPRQKTEMWTFWAEQPQRTTDVFSSSRNNARGFQLKQARIGSTRQCRVLILTMRRKKRRPENIPTMTTALPSRRENQMERGRQTDADRRREIWPFSCITHPNARTEGRVDRWREQWESREYHRLIQFSWAQPSNIFFFPGRCSSLFCSFHARPAEISNARPQVCLEEARIWVEQVFSLLSHSYKKSPLLYPYPESYYILINLNLNQTN